MAEAAEWRYQPVTNEVLVQSRLAILVRNPGVVDTKAVFEVIGDYFASGNPDGWIHDDEARVDNSNGTIALVGLYRDLDEYDDAWIDRSQYDGQGRYLKEANNYHLDIFRITG